MFIPLTKQCTRMASSGHSYIGPRVYPPDNTWWPPRIVQRWPKVQRQLLDFASSPIVSIRRGWNIRRRFDCWCPCSRRIGIWLQWRSRDVRWCRSSRRNVFRTTICLWLVRRGGGTWWYGLGVKRVLVLLFLLLRLWRFGFDHLDHLILWIWEQCPSVFVLVRRRMNTLILQQLLIRQCTSYTFPWHYFRGQCKRKRNRIEILKPPKVQVYRLQFLSEMEELFSTVIIISCFSYVSFHLFICVGKWVQNDKK